MVIIIRVQQAGKFLRYFMLYVGSLLCSWCLTEQVIFYLKSCTFYGESHRVCIECSKVNQKFGLGLWKKKVMRLKFHSFSALLLRLFGFLYAGFIFGEWKIGLFSKLCIFRSSASPQLDWVRQLYYYCLEEGLNSFRTLGNPPLIRMIPISEPSFKRFYKPFLKGFQLRLSICLKFRAKNFELCFQILSISTFNLF